MKNKKFIVKLNILFKGVYTEEKNALTQEQANEQVLAESNQLSLNEFTEISSDYSIAGAKRNFNAELSDMQDDVISELETELKRVGRDFDAEEEQEKGELEFFSYLLINDLGIETIKADGSVIMQNIEPIDVSLSSLINNGDISLLDALGLLNDLRDLPDGVTPEV